MSLVAQHPVLWVEHSQHIVPWDYGGVTVSPSPQPKAGLSYLLPVHSLGLAKAASFYCLIPHRSFR